MGFLLALYVVFLIIKRHKYRVSFCLGIPAITIVYSICALKIDNLLKFVPDSSSSAGAAIGMVMIVYAGIELGVPLCILFIDLLVNAIIHLKSVKSRNFSYFLELGWIFFLIGSIVLMIIFLGMAIPDIIFHSFLYP